MSAAEINGYDHLHGGVQMAWVEAAARHAVETTVNSGVWQATAIERMDFSAPGREGDLLRCEVAPMQPSERDNLTVMVTLFAEGPQRPEPVQLATAWVRFEKKPKNPLSAQPQELPSCK